ncbi:MAG TPA: inorganic diphosphatase [Candidatus Paceibacterota bacterium]
MSTSFELAKPYLGQVVTVKMDRPLGSKHPKHGFVYEANYGFIEGTKSADGAELDAYFLGTDQPLNEASGECVAIIHRLNDDDDKLIVVPAGTTMSDEQILKATHFQEKYFKSEIIR